MLEHITDDIRNLIGREAIFYSATLSGCSSCSLDPVTNESTDSFCAVCGGVYWVKTYVGTSLTGHITWGAGDVLDWRAGGQMFDGDVRIQIKYQSGTISMLDNTEYIVVDGKKVEEKKRILRGVPTIYRVLIDCIILEKEA